MFKVIEYKDLIEDFKDYVLIDVRSPKEYETCTIPGAVNIPLFTDEERETIGKVYVNEDVDKAKRLGIEAVSKKLPEIFDQVLNFHKTHRNLVFFCARGGMRSGSITALVNSIGINGYRIKGGYKGYREFVNNELPKANENIKYIVVHGKTGIGKTEILKTLGKRGYDILDLEACANHRGSLLGSVGIGQCRSQKMFESLLLERLRERKTNYVFIEGESKRIGSVTIPNYIFETMVNGYHIYIERELDERAELLVEEYIKEENATKEILTALDAMERYIGKSKRQHYEDLICKEKFYDLAKELMMDYYDPMYLNSIKKYEFQWEFHINSLEQGVKVLEHWYQMKLGLGEGLTEPELI